MLILHPHELTDVKYYLPTRIVRVSALVQDVQCIQLRNNAQRRKRARQSEEENNCSTKHVGLDSDMHCCVFS